MSPLNRGTYHSDCQDSPGFWTFTRTKKQPFHRILKLPDINHSDNLLDRQWNNEQGGGQSHETFTLEAG